MIPPIAPMRLRAAVTASAVAAALAALFAAPAMAAPGGAATVVSDGPAATSLRAAGVAISPLRPATGGARRAHLPVATGLAGTSASLLRLKGGIAFRRGTHKLGLTALSLVIGPKRARIRAKLGGDQVELFRIANGHAASVDPDAGTIALGDLKLRLTAAAGRKIAGRLGIEHPRKRAFGRLSGRALGLAASGPAPQSAAEQSIEGCPAAGGAGYEPESPLPVATRPPAAVDIASADVTWHVRESFIRYINTGEGTSVSGGATADPPVVLPGTSAALTYSFHFPFAEGWADDGADPSDPVDDVATVDFGGGVRFQYSEHEIDLATSDPEFEIAGDRSRAIFAIAEGGGAPERQVLVNLDLARAVSVATSGKTTTYDRIPVAIPAGTAGSVFAGFYPPGTEFGCVSLSYTAS